MAVCIIQVIKSRALAPAMPDLQMRPDLAFFPQPLYYSCRSQIPEGAGGFNPLKDGKSTRPSGPDSRPFSTAVSKYNCSTKGQESSWQLSAACKAVPFQREFFPHLEMRLPCGGTAK
jgi:hypothetical protein